MREVTLAYQFRGNVGMPEESGRRAESSGPERVDTRASGAGRRRSLPQVLALVFGAAFALMGIAGFIPGITTNYDELSLLGTDSNAQLLGLFRVSVLHNIAHLLFGVGILAAATESASILYLVAGGALYGGLALFGFVIDQQSEVNFLPVDDADSLLHAGLAVAMLLGGLAALAAARRTRQT
jgi:hypothetical protein